MTTRRSELTDAELDGMLDRLMAPAPSELLERRIQAMAPQPLRRAHLPRFAAAAALVLAVAAAAILHVSMLRETATAQVYDPAGEIEVQHIDLVDPPAGPARPEIFSVAGLPLE